MIVIYFLSSNNKNIKASQQVFQWTLQNTHCESGREAKDSYTGKMMERGVMLLQIYLILLPIPEVQRRELSMRCLS